MKCGEGLKKVMGKKPLHMVVKEKTASGEKLKAVFGKKK
jgi:hypothetical protein